MTSGERSRRIPRHLEKTNSVGELVAALDAPQALSHSPKVVSVTDSTYVRNGFFSVHSWCAKGWILPSGQRVARVARVRCGTRFSGFGVSGALDFKSPCARHIRVSRVTNVQKTWRRGALRLRSQKFVRRRRPRLLSPSRWLIFVLRANIHTRG